MLQIGNKNNLDQDPNLPILQILLTTVKTRNEINF